MKTSMLFIGEGLHRAAEFRRDEAWIAAKLGDPRSRILPVWRDRSLVLHGDAASAVMVTGADVPGAVELASEVVLLGVDGDVAYFAADLSHHETPSAGFLNGGAQFMDLREIGPLVEAKEGAMLALARGLMYWHRNHRFCGVCGNPTASRSAGFVRKCTNEACGREHYPRTDPAIIVLVTRDDNYCLLGRQAVWPGQRYSTLAGFVEPGETLEAAVAREVHEETGVRISDARYQASQPWPFPTSLMLGFRAHAESREITLNDSELEDARWFSRDDVANFETRDFQLPRFGSISRWLIAGWLADTA